MSTQTKRDDVRIVDSVDDGGKMLRRAPMLGAIVGVLLASALVAAGGASALWMAPTLILAAIAAGHDLRSGRLPDELVVAAGASGLLAAVGLHGLGGLAPALTGVAALSAPLLVIHLASPCAMAFGDVKFAAALGVLIGIAGTDANDRVFLAMTALSVAGGIAALAALVVRSRQVPFGPSLYLSTVTVLTFAVVTRNPLA